MNKHTLVGRTRAKAARRCLRSEDCTCAKLMMKWIDMIPFDDYRWQAPGVPDAVFGALKSPDDLMWVRDVLATLQRSP